jgi:hypothetical protein
MRPHPKINPKVGAFFTTTQGTTNSPQSTINPPQIHHQKTTQKTHNPRKIATSTIANI